ncbi:MAG: hypothetical protein ABJO36_03300 [Litorimonas sp.]
MSIRIYFFRAWFVGMIFLLIIGAIGCGAETKQRKEYLVGCCNYVSASFCLNDYKVQRIERFSVRDFVLTSLYDGNDDLMFSIYEGNHPDVEAGDIKEKIEINDLKIERFKKNAGQVLVSIDDGNYPSKIHFQNFSTPEYSSIDSNNSDRWVFFRTEPEYQQSPQCAYDYSANR